MAANKFATMLHRNANRITMVLIYAVLEWTLIVLLLLNSLFSYLIVKFAEFVGLKPPCLWCSRVDHVFEPGKSKNMHRDLLCEAHAREISGLGYCSNHRKLVESKDMCEDCLSSKPELQQQLASQFAFFGMIQTPAGEERVLENGHRSSECSCCGVSLDSDLYPRIVIKPSWEVLGHAKNMKFIGDKGGSDFASDGCGVEDCFEGKDENMVISDGSGDFDGKVLKVEDEGGLVTASYLFELRELGNNEGENLGVGEEMEEIGEEKLDMAMKDEAIQVSYGEDLEFFVDCNGHRLVPVELIDSATDEDQNRDNAKDEDQGSAYEGGSNSGFEFQEKAENEVPIEDGCVGVQEDAEHSVHMNEESSFTGFGAVEIEEDDNSLIFYAKDFSAAEVTMDQTISQDAGEAQAMEAVEKDDQHSDVHLACQDITQTPVDETETEVSVGIEIPDSVMTNDVQTQKTCAREDPFTSSLSDATDGRDSMQVDKQTIELHTLSVVVNEIEEYRAAETPTSMDSLHRKLLVLEKKDSGTEDSFDGSINSELEGGDGVVTIEGLKSALRAERKTLHALYAELEEERNASAIAANQTMAMINRLQEEKAAMQMEALQYQRMMEEQAEYDQEALQLLNELMVKREKEKEELEKELEVNRKKLFEYEAKEKLRMLRKSKDGSSGSGLSSPSPSSFSNAGDSDAASVDLNQESKAQEDGFYSNRESESDNTPVNAVLNLEESIADFEDERLSILEQLKNLEEKLTTLDDEDLQHFEGAQPIEHHTENGTYKDQNGHFDSLENSRANGFTKEMNGKLHPEKISSIAEIGKSLLPLFDATSDENGDSMFNGNYENGVDFNGVHKSITPEFELESKRVYMEDELDHLYGRLQALEADREFLKHCISSLNKGEKGMHLLHEILQHLRDLRNVDLRMRNLNDGILV